MKNIYKHTTNLVIKKLKEGTVPWTSITSITGAGLPKNFESKREYSGINTLMLGMAGYASPNYLTYKQAQALGGHVRKGESGEKVFYFQMVEKVNKETGDKETYPMAKGYTVFNLSQIDGIEDDFVVEEFDNEKKQALENLKTQDHLPPVEEGLRSTGSYIPELDKINMPELKYCTSAERYYKTLCHEYAHSTGHESRLKRDLTGDFKSDKYAFEELIAELSASMLAGHYGFQDETIDCTASYINSWISRLENDHTLIYKASKEAQRVYKYILKEE